MIICNKSGHVMFFGAQRVDPNQQVSLEKSVWGKNRNIEALIAKGELVLVKSKK